MALGSVPKTLPLLKGVSNVVDLIILGMGPSRSSCPFNADEIWGVNNGYRQVIELKGKLHKLFICHANQERDAHGDPIFNWEELKIIADAGVELMTLFDIPHLTKYTKFEFQDLVDYFNTNYFSDSIAYMIAYAIKVNSHKENGLIVLNEPMRIRMYGVDMHTHDEYLTERGGIEYFIAIAKTIGIDFWIHADSSVCKTVSGKPYGFDSIDKNLIDPNNIMELQKTPEGINKIFELGLIDEDRMGLMLKVLNERNSNNS
jgi:hypothetical protein